MVATLTKTQVKKLMAQFKINGELSGKGMGWEVELADDKAKRAFTKNVAKVGGYRTGWGGWVLRPNYVGLGDWNDKSSAWHY